jgi:hypothetical protein
MNGIYDDVFASMRVITMRTAFTMLSIRMHRMGGQWNNSRGQRQA